MYCIKCGAHMSERDSFCNSCGTPAGGGSNSNQYQYQGQGRPTYYHKEKDIGIALILGFFINGLGHIYLGKVAKGLGIMVICFSIGMINATIIFNSFSLTNGYYEFSNLIVPMLIMSFVSFIIWIWQLYDAYSLGKEYNEHLRRTGQPLW